MSAITFDDAPSEGRRTIRDRYRAVKGKRAGLLRNLVIFGLVVILGIAAGTWFVLQEDLILPWQAKTNYYADFQDASAIAPGQHQEVRVAGVDVGQIGSASVTSSGTAHVQLEITDTHLKIYQNATALLQSKTPLNEQYIELDPGTAAAAPLKAGGTIPLAQTQSPVEVDAILQHLGPEQQMAIKVLLEETNVAMTNASAYLPSDFKSLDDTVSGLKPVASALATRQAKIRTLVTDLTQISQAVGGNQAQLASLITAAQKTLTTLSDNDTSLSSTLSDLPKTTKALGSSLTSVQTLTGQLNPLLDNLQSSAKVLPKALATLSSTVQNLHPVVNELSPLITQATPVVADVHTYLGSANPTLQQVKDIVPDLKPLTDYLDYDMPWLKGFFYNTDSVFSTYQPTAAGYKVPVVRSLIISGASGLEGFACQLGLNLPSSLSGTSTGCPSS